MRISLLSFFITHLCVIRCWSFVLGRWSLIAGSRANSRALNRKGREAVAKIAEEQLFCVPFRNLGVFAVKNFSPSTVCNRQSEIYNLKFPYFCVLPLTSSLPTLPFPPAWLSISNSSAHPAHPARSGPD